MTFQSTEREPVPLPDNLPDHLKPVRIHFASRFYGIVAELKCGNIAWLKSDDSVELFDSLDDLPFTWMTASPAA